MKKHLLGGLAAVLVIGISASAAHSQCAFPHPKKASKFQSTLVEAFVSCGNVGGNSPNTKTEGGVDSCKPVETYSAQAGNTVTGWRFDPLKGSGQVQFKALKGPGKTVTPNNTLNPPGDTTDLGVAAKLSGVVDCVTGPLCNSPASGNGALATSARATFNDRMNGDMTVTDFPANFPITLTLGKAKLKTSADVLLNAISQPGLPHCTSIETVSITVVDENGDTFANTGTFLP